MIATAKDTNVYVSQYKLRKFADGIRGKSVDRALEWLRACMIKRAVPLLKVLASACANARSKDETITSLDGLYVSQVKVDQGPYTTYFKPGARGRGKVLRRRSSRIEVVLDMKKKP